MIFFRRFIRLLGSIVFLFFLLGAIRANGQSCLSELNILTEAKGMEKGSDWTEPMNLSQTPGAVSRQPVITVDSTGRVHAVWVEDDQLEASGGGSVQKGASFHSIESEVMYATWYDGAWSKPVDIIFDHAEINWPTLVADNAGELHLVYWSRGQLFYTNSKPYGQSVSARFWKTPISLTRMQGEQSGRFPKLSIGRDQNLWLAYENLPTSTASDTRLPDLRLMASDNIVAVVVPSPAISLVFEATSFTICAPRFS